MMSMTTCLRLRNSFISLQQHSTTWFKLTTQQQQRFLTRSNNNIRTRIQIQTNKKKPQDGGGGGGGGGKVYQLLLSQQSTEDEVLIGSLRVNGPILWGATNHTASSAHQKNNKLIMSISETCGPLVKKAVNDLEELGVQVQALSALHGLCEWIREEETEKVEQCLQALCHNNDNSYRELKEAVMAIAHGRPRPGHSVLGQGTFRDARPGWEALARSYAQTDSEECHLYTSLGASPIAVEYLADTSESYMKSAGGSMMRFMFIDGLASPQSR